MFTQKWRDHWGLAKDPFACEDADKDPLLGEVDSSAVHTGFDRIFGNPDVPAPGIVFGEKGSGKSGLRRMMKRRIEEWNAAYPGKQVFLVEYIDFDVQMEHFRQAIGASADPRKASKAVVAAWQLSDHLDAMLSIGVTQLLDEVLEQGRRPDKLTRKQKTDLQLLTALYDRSPRRTTEEAIRGLRSALKIRGSAGATQKTLAVLVTLLAAFVALAPHLSEWLTWGVALGDPVIWYVAGGVLAALAWGTYEWGQVSASWAARRADKSVRTMPIEAAPLANVLRTLRRKERGEYVLPSGVDEAPRYDLLGRFLGLLKGFGYSGAYVLVDRVDEPSLLSGNDQNMREFVRKLLDIKLLQFPDLAIKLFLPIEMETLHRTASPEELKRMRLDKSNLIQELKWTGQELYEIADQRMKASLDPEAVGANGAKARELRDLFADDLDFQHVKDTLNSLGTPRYAFGFLSAVFSEYVRELPNDLPADEPRWRVPRASFDVQRGAWLDHTGVLRRSLN